MEDQKSCGCGGQSKGQCSAPTEPLGDVKSETYKRNIFIVDLRSQSVIILSCCAIPMISVCLWQLLVWYTFTSTGMIRFFSLDLALFLIMLTCLSGAWGIVISNRLVGPLYKLNRLLVEHRENLNFDFSNVFFRRKDFFKDFLENLKLFIVYRKR